VVSVSASKACDAADDAAEQLFGRMSFDALI
jgi:hypothetical protein